MSDEIRDNELLELLLRSSHFLHHRRGGKRGQGKILKILAEHPQISQKELQELLGIESGSMSELVIKLEHKGLITREKDEADKRMTTLTITEHGLELSKELEAEASGEEQILWSALSAEEQEQLKQLLSKLLSGWEESYEGFRGGRHHHKGCGHHGHHDGHHGHHGDHDHHGHHCNHDKEEHREHHSHHGDHDHHSHHSHHDKEEHREHHGHHRDHDHHSHHSHQDKEEHREHHGHHRDHDHHSHNDRHDDDHHDNHKH